MASQRQPERSARRQAPTLLYRVARVQAHPDRKAWVLPLALYVPLPVAVGLAAGARTAVQWGRYRLPAQVMRAVRAVMGLERRAGVRPDRLQVARAAMEQRELEAAEAAEAARR